MGILQDLYDENVGSRVTGIKLWAKRRLESAREHPDMFSSPMASVTSPTTVDYGKSGCSQYVCTMEYASSRRQFSLAGST